MIGTANRSVAKKGSMSIRHLSITFRLNVTYIDTLIYKSTLTDTTHRIIHM